MDGELYDEGVCDAGARLVLGMEMLVFWGVRWFFAILDSDGMLLGG